MGDIEILISGRLDPNIKARIQKEIEALNKKAQEAKTSGAKLTNEELKMQRAINQLQLSNIKVEKETVALQSAKIKLQQQELQLERSNNALQTSKLRLQQQQVSAQNSITKANKEARKSEDEAYNAGIKAFEQEKKLQENREKEANRQEEADKKRYVRTNTYKLKQIENRINAEQKAQKYSFNQEQLYTQQKFNLEQKLQRFMIQNKESIAKGDMKGDFSKLHQQISGSTGSVKAFSNQFELLKTRIVGVKSNMKVLTKDGYSFATMLATGIKKMIIWGASATLLYAPLRALQAGLNTLKELDTLMVDIAKVTNLSADAMERLVVRSFDASSALGQTAQSYLAAVAEFSRAGYEGQAEGLAELALLSQNVGELTSEQATQFLLATDAAYKYNGAQSELGKVLDGVNEIDNQYATSIEKITEGMTVSGNIAANAGVGVDELSAALGTMTAVTQRSGSEAGRAFRGILMNLRQIKGETEDGDIIDDESLSKSAKALAAVGIKVHEMRNGIEELRDPMEILEELSNKWTKLSSMQQAPIIEALGGKYRGN